MLNTIRGKEPSLSSADPDTMNKSGAAPKPPEPPKQPPAPPIPKPPSPEPEKK